MNTIPLILSGAVFIVILIVYFAFSFWFSHWKKKHDILQRTQKWCENTTSHTQKTHDTGVKHNPGIGQAVKDIFKGSEAKKKGIKESIFSGTPLFYQRAGIYNTNRLKTYQSLRVVFAAIPLLLFAGIIFFLQYPFTPQNFVFVCAASFIGFYLPILWLKIKAKNRRKELDRTFPDAIDLLMVCVEAGMGIDSAIRRVSKEIYVTSPELAKEFRILSLELKTGKPRNECLRNLARRTNLSDIDNLVSLLIQAEKYGTGVSNALKIHAEEMRQKRYSRLEEAAAKLPVKLVVPLVLFIFPALFTVILAPGAIQIFRAIIQRGQ